MNNICSQNAARGSHAAAQWGGPLSLSATWHVSRPWAVPAETYSRQGFEQTPRSRVPLGHEIEHYDIIKRYDIILYYYEIEHYDIRGYVELMWIYVGKLKK